MPFDKWARYRQNVAPRDKRTYRGDVAQLGEHHVRNVGVEGSNPFISTTKPDRGEAIGYAPIFVCRQIVGIGGL